MGRSCVLALLLVLQGLPSAVALCYPESAVAACHREDRLLPDWVAACHHGDRRVAFGVVAPLLPRLQPAAAAAAAAAREKLQLLRRGV
jgi:hypothetical protein